jgi:hypothetical protein
VLLRRVGDTVEMSLLGLSSNKAINRVLGKLPAGFRPAHHQSLVTCDGRFQQARVEVSANSGAVEVSQPKGAESLGAVSTSLVWLTDDDWPRTLPGRDWNRR